MDDIRASGLTGQPSANPPKSNDGTATGLGKDFDADNEHVSTSVVRLACRVYVVASAEIGEDWPKGDCFACGCPLREHEKRVSALAPPGTAYVIDEAMLHFPEAEAHGR